MHFGNDLRRARETARLTQGELATSLGVSLRTVGNWERGETEPRNARAAIEQALGRPIGEQPAAGPTLAEASDAQIATELVNRLAQLRREATQHAQTIAQSKQSPGSPPGSSSRPGAPTTTSEVRDKAVSAAIPDLTHALEGGSSTRKKNTNQG